MMIIMLAAGAEGEERGVSIMLFVPFFLLDYLAIMETGILLL